jgi:hypothetical protein
MQKGGAVKRKFIPVEEAFGEWRKAPEFVTAYDALEDEFAAARALYDRQTKQAALASILRRDYPTLPKAAFGNSMRMAWLSEAKSC